MLVNVYDRRIRVCWTRNDSCGWLTCSQLTKITVCAFISGTFILCIDRPKNSSVTELTNESASGP